ncbi:hypothetical protein N7453_007542 [Penicillium expansum]|nr:hypothetical protein N7453_007542 [Penicillium expansum]
MTLRAGGFIRISRIDNCQLGLSEENGLVADPENALVFEAGYTRGLENDEEGPMEPFVPLQALAPLYLERWYLIPQHLEYSGIGDRST